MHQFLDQILNPVSTMRRPSQTQSNSDMQIKQFQEEKINEGVQFEGDDSRQLVESDSYSREQVTEQIVFQEELQSGSPIYRKQGYTVQQDYLRKNLQQQQLKSGGISEGQDRIIYLTGGQQNINIGQGVDFVGYQDQLQIQQAIVNKQIVIRGQNEMRQIGMRVQSEMKNQQQTQIQSNKDNTYKISQMNNIKQFPQIDQPVLSTQRRWQIQKKLIKEQLQQRYMYRIQRLEHQLQEKHNYEQQFIDTHNQRQLSSDPPSQNSLFQVQRLSLQIETLRKQLQGKDIHINQLEMDNQRLNQHIFDVEQKIQGIQLQVETRVRNRINQLDKQHSPSQFKNQIIEKPQLTPIIQIAQNLQHSNNLYALESFNDLLISNSNLKHQLQQIQHQKDSIQNQLKQHDKIISFREEQIKKNQEDINFQWTQIERERQLLLMRENQLITAEENISKQISEIRLKETQLEKWENQIHKRQIQLDRSEQQLKRKLQNFDQRQRQHQFRTQKQNLSNISPNRNSRNHFPEFNNAGGDGRSLSQKEIDIPRLPIDLKFKQQQDFRQQRSFQNQYQQRNKVEFRRGNPQRSYQDIDKSYNRFSKEKQKISNGANYIRPSRKNHQFVLPQNSKVQPKRSKSKSQQKNILRNNLNPNSTSSVYKNTSFRTTNRPSDELYTNKPTTNLDGLGSKLQRLRDQIKREIDSIK